MKEKENTKRCVIYATYVGMFQYIRGLPSGWGRLLVVDKVDPPRPEGQRELKVSAVSGPNSVAEGLPTNQMICCKSDKNDVLTDHPIFSALAWGLRQIVASTFQSSISPGTVGRLLGVAQIFYISEFLQEIYPGARERERTGPVSKKIKSLASQQGAKG